MTLFTYSKFYFDYTVTQENQALDFDEGSGEIQATLRVGKYSLNQIAQQVAATLNDTGTQEYTVSVNRVTRRITISAPSNFSLLCDTGTRQATSIWETIGFDTATDKTGANSYLGENAAGKEYATQFWLQDYISTDDFQEAAEGVVNQAADGSIEVVRFGIRRFMEANFKYICNVPPGQSWGAIRNYPNGVERFREFARYLVTKGPFEFMPDEDKPAEFQTLILESTPQSAQGLGYRLRDQLDNVAGLYESGLYKFREV